MLPEIAIITPCYNEGPTVVRFLQQLQRTLVSLPWQFTVLVVDDGSKDDTVALLQGYSCPAPNVTLQVLSLPVNKGHQAAIHAGMVHMHHTPCRHFIIMDSDGEDDPFIIPELLGHSHAAIVQVQRQRRHEGMLFRTITGRHMRCGNYSLISRPVMEQAVVQGFSHLAAFLGRQQVTRAYVLADKGIRLGGASKMSFRQHCIYALHSFGEYGYSRYVQVFKRIISS